MSWKWRMARELRWKSCHRRRWWLSRHKGVHPNCPAGRPSSSSPSRYKEGIMAASLILSAGLVVIAWLWLRFAKREVSLPIWSTLGIPELAEDASPFVSIVVAAGHRAHDLERCVRSLLRQDYARFEVIVVDASSGHETRERLLEMEATTEGTLR